MADQKINSLDGTFGDVVVPLKTSLAWNGTERSAGNVHPVTINVRLSGVKLQAMAKDALGQGAVKFQRTRRSKDSGGVFEKRESFDEYVQNLGEEVDLHYSQLGQSPTDPGKAEEQFEASLGAMTPEQQEKMLLEKLEALRK